MSQIDTTFERFTRTGDPDCGPLPITLLDDLLKKKAEEFSNSLWRTLPKRRLMPDLYPPKNDKAITFRIKKVLSDPISQSLLGSQDFFNDFLGMMIEDLYIHIENSLFYESPVEDSLKSLSNLVGLTYDCEHSPITEKMIQEAGECILGEYGYPTHLYMSPDVYSCFMENMTPHMRYSMPGPQVGIGIIKEMLTSAGRIEVHRMNPPLLCSDYSFKSKNLIRELPKAFLLSINPSIIEYLEFFPAIMIREGNEFNIFYKGRLVLAAPRKQLLFIRVADSVPESYTKGLDSHAIDSTRYMMEAKSFFPDPMKSLTNHAVGGLRNIIEPKDNNGRETCFWCQKPTVQKECFTSIYNFCESCKK